MHDIGRVCTPDNAFSKGIWRKVEVFSEKDKEGDRVEENKEGFKASIKELPAVQSSAEIWAKFGSGTVNGEISDEEGKGRKVKPKRELFGKSCDGVSQIGGRTEEIRNEVNGKIRHLSQDRETFFEVKGNANEESNQDQDGRNNTHVL